MREPEASVFTPEQQAELATILGDDYGRLASALENTVRTYKSSPDLKSVATAHTVAAKKLEQACVSFLHSIDSAAILGHQAQALGFRSVGGSSRTPDMGSTLGEILGWRWRALNKSRSSVNGLLEQARDWRTRSFKQSRRRRGPQVEQRRRLATFVGLQLAVAGIRPTTYYKNEHNLERGVFVKTLEVVYEAAGLDVPLDMFLDLSAAVKTIKKEYPEYLRPHK